MRAIDERGWVAVIGRLRQWCRLVCNVVGGGCVFRKAGLVIYLEQGRFARKRLT